jgi:hypothetical protein
MNADFEVINLTYILKASGRKPEVIPQLLLSYQWKLPRMKTALREFFDQRLTSPLGLVAYQIKEILPILGLKEVSIGLATVAQECLKEPDWELCGTNITRFEADFPAIMRDLDKALLLHPQESSEHTDQQAGQD